MPGYGGTWTSTDPSEFAMEKVVPDMVELLAHLGHKQAVWVGHDWGCGPLYGLASHHPEACRAIIGISVPYRTLELGLSALVGTGRSGNVPREGIPTPGSGIIRSTMSRIPRRQDRQFEANLPEAIKLVYSRGSAVGGRSIARTSEVVKNKGWFGGAANQLPDIPLKMTVLDQEVFDALVSSARQKGWHGATNWYLNHPANKKYTLEKSVDEGRLKMPVLFVHTEHDAVCQTVWNPKFMEQMCEKCGNLTEFVVKAGHWGAAECPEEVNSGIVEWIGKDVRDWWPGPELKGRL